MASSTETTIQGIVKSASEKVEAMGGGEQFIGRLHDLAEACGVGDRTTFMVELGDALEDVGLQLSSGPGAPEDLYASRLE